MLQPEIEENIKKSFAKVKEHIQLLEQDLATTKSILSQQKEQISLILSKIEQLNKSLLDKNQEKSSAINDILLQNKVSNGKEGVYSFIHSHIHSNIHSLKQIAQPQQTILPPLSQLKASLSTLSSSLQEQISALSRQEFLVFLSLYNLLEEKKAQASPSHGFIGILYTDLASCLSLSEGCIRTYIAALIKKGIPIIKRKTKNKLVYLSLSDEFLSLNLKDAITMLFLSLDKSQKKLTDNF